LQKYAELPYLLNRLYSILLSPPFIKIILGFFYPEKTIFEHSGDSLTTLKNLPLIIWKKQPKCAYNLAVM